jgi:hypothetical protein
MNLTRQVTFQTDFFTPVPSEDDATNPERYGKALAEWLAPRLRDRGVTVESVIPEDFGWVVMLSRKPFLLWLGCGNTDGNTNAWSVSTVVELSTIQRIFRRTDPTPEVEKLTAHLLELVPSIPGVTNIIWE